MTEIFPLSSDRCSLLKKNTKETKKLVKLLHRSSVLGQLRPVTPPLSLSLVLFEFLFPPHHTPPTPALSFSFYFNFLPLPPHSRSLCSSLLTPTPPTPAFSILISSSPLHPQLSLSARLGLSLLTCARRQSCLSLTGPSPPILVYIAQLLHSSETKSLV